MNTFCMYSRLTLGLLPDMFEPEFTFSWCLVSFYSDFQWSYFYRHCVQTSSDREKRHTQTTKIDFYNKF